MKYFIRAIKQFLLFAILFCIIITILFYTTNKGPEVNTPMDLFKDGSWWQMLIFFIAMSVVYPLVGYYNKKIYVNEDFAKKKQNIINIMTGTGRYILVSDENGELVFRLRSKFLRFMRVYEDAIVVEYLDNPIIISGPRKDIVRYCGGIEALALSSENNENI